MIDRLYSPREALLTMDSAAATLHISRRTLQDLIKLHPHYKVAGKRRKLFSQSDITKICEAIQCPSTLSSAKAQEPGISGGPSEESLLTEARKLTIGTRRRLSASRKKTDSSNVVFMANGQR